MLIAKLSDGALVLGLSHENVQRLQAGQPIRISHEGHGVDMPAGCPAIYIMVGETEVTLLANVKATEWPPNIVRPL